MPFAEKKLSLQVTTTVSYINTRLIHHRFAAQRYKNIGKGDIDNHFVRSDINETVVAMKVEGLIDFEWFRGEENHIIKRLWLNVERIDSAYQAADRRSASTSLTAIPS